jgi:hypothetical protein
MRFPIEAIVLALVGAGIAHASAAECVSTAEYAQAPQLWIVSPQADATVSGRVRVSLYSYSGRLATGEFPPLVKFDLYVDGALSGTTAVDGRFRGYLTWRARRHPRAPGGEPPPPPGRRGLPGQLRPGLPGLRGLDRRAAPAPVTSSARAVGTGTRPRAASAP